MIQTIRSQTRGWLVLVMVLASGATTLSCGPSETGEPQERTLSVRIDTMRGIVHVRNSGEARPRRLRSLVELGRVGGVGEVDPEEFGRINSVTLDDDGRVFVADAYALEIRVFSPLGDYMASWGRGGEGPGEFGAPYSLGWLGDTLAVLDPRLGRIGLFDRDGAWLDQRPYPAGLSGPTSWIRFYPVGPSELYVPSLRATSSGFQREWARHRTGEATASLTAVAPSVEIVECPTPDGGISFFQVPFSPALEQTPAPAGRLALAWTADYRIAFITAEGDTTRVIERSHTPALVTPLEWERALEEYRQFREDWPGVRCSPGMPERPAVKPAIAKLYHDRAGRLWVEAITANGNRFDVYDQGGKLIGEVLAPPYVDRVAPHLDTSRLAVVVADSLGVERVKVLAIEEEAS